MVTLGNSADSVCHYPVQWGTVLISTLTVAFSGVQCWSVGRYSIVQWIAVALYSGVPWNTEAM